MEAPRKCEVHEGRINPCFGMIEILDGGPSGNRKGVVCWNFVDLKTQKFTRNLYGVKSGKHVKNGMLFNFCPICGVEIHPQPDEDDNSPKPAESEASQPSPNTEGE